MIAPVRVLFRRWACLILGGALLMPYMMAGEVLTTVLYGIGQPGDPLLAVQPFVFLAVLPVVALTGLFLPVRALEATAAQALLGAQVEPPVRGRHRTWEERRRTAYWFSLHLALGGIVSGLTLAVLPFTVWTFLLPFIGNPLHMLNLTVEPGWQAAWWPLVGIASAAALLALPTAAGHILSRLAPGLLGPSPDEQLAAAEETARELAERNRLARELHDSVGHALSVVTLQAAAAGRVLDRDPETARTALGAIEQAARAALEDLDHVLGVLREGDGPRQPQATLADLDGLIRSSGADVRPEVGDLSAVPAVVSREAYRIVQEALTNAIKHGQGPVRLAAAVQGHDLELEVSNRAGSAEGPGGGRGVAGMRERVQLLRGSMQAGAADGQWRVSVRLPLRSGT